jgi:DNA-binding CsgD family transcriptional regulator
MRKLSDFLLRLSRGALEKPASEFKDWALSEVSCLIPFDSSVWLMGSWIDDQPVVHTAHLYKLGNGFIESWMRFQHEDKLAREVTRIGNKTINVDAAVEYGGTDIYNHHCKSFGVEHIVATGAIHPDTQLLNSVCLYRANIGQPFSEEDRSLKELIFRHLIEAARTNWLTNLPNMFSDRQRSSFNSLAACEQSGILHIAMPPFVELCREEWPKWTGPFLPREVLECLGDGTREFVGKNVVINQIQLNNIFLLRGRLKVRADSLSEREIQIARQVAEGNDYKTIALLLGVSPATVKTHVNNIFMKLDINDKARLGMELAKMYL